MFFDFSTKLLKEPDFSKERNSDVTRLGLPLRSKTKISKPTIAKYRFFEIGKRENVKMKRHHRTDLLLN
jgi:hypothetical protein